MAVALFFTATAHAAAPGITGPTFNLQASPAYITQPDGSMIYSWGYGCNGAPSGFAPAAIQTTFCSAMQLPGPTLIVTQGQTVTVNLTNNLPSRGGQHVDPVSRFQRDDQRWSGWPADAGSSARRHGDLHVHRSDAGNALLLQRHAGRPAGRDGAVRCDHRASERHSGRLHQRACTPRTCSAQGHWGENDFRLAAAAYNHPKACYDREYLFQFSEMDPRIHREALVQVNATAGCVAGAVRVAA